MRVKSGGVVQLSRNPDVPIVSSDNATASRLQLVPCRVWRTISVEQRPYCVSLVDPDRPQWFIRHYGWLLQTDPEYAPPNPTIFDLDASFLLHRDTFYRGYYALESVNGRNRYIQGQARSDGRIGVNEYQGTTEYHDTTSFSITFYD